MLKLALSHSRWHCKIHKPCYPRLSIFRSHLLRACWFNLILVTGFFGKSLTWTKVCFISSRHSFKYHGNTFMLTCRSRGKRLVISSSYHTCILSILNPLSYSITYPSWLATSYGCPFVMASMWSYHRQFRYSFVLVPLHEWMYINPWYTLRYYELLFWTMEHMFKQKSPTFSLVTSDSQHIVKLTKASLPCQVQIHLPILKEIIKVRMLSLI
jgi:hypothetical protein